MGIILESEEDFKNDEIKPLSPTLDEQQRLVIYSSYLQGESDILRQFSVPPSMMGEEYPFRSLQELAIKIMACSAFPKIEKELVIKQIISSSPIPKQIEEKDPKNLIVLSFNRIPKKKVIL